MIEIVLVTLAVLRPEHHAAPPVQRESADVERGDAGRGRDREAAGIALDHQSRAVAFAGAARAGEADVFACVHELLEGGAVVDHG